MFYLYRKYSRGGLSRSGERSVFALRSWALMSQSVTELVSVRRALICGAVLSTHAAFISLAMTSPRSLPFSPSN